MGCEAALKSCASVRQTYRIRRLYCRCATDRRQAGLLRPSARSGPLAPTNGPAARGEILAPAHVRRLSSPRRHSASAAGVGALGGYDGSDGLRSGPKNHAPRYIRNTAFSGFTAAARQIVGKPDSYGLRPEADPSRQYRPSARSETLAPTTAFGQKQNPRSSTCPSAIFATPPFCFCRRRRSSRRLRRQRWAAKRP